MEGAHGSQSAGTRAEDRNTQFGAGVAVSLAAALAAGFALRVWMWRKFGQINGDSLIYGDMAKNLLEHGRLALTNSDGSLQPTLMRLPGYPLFLAVCFGLLGVANYTAVIWVQIALELLGCVILADFVRRIASPRAAHCTLWLAALCPFTAVYASAPLTETPTLFVLALALWSMARFQERPGWASALLFTFAVTYAALLRPDGALVAVALAPGMLLSAGLGRSAQGASRAEARGTIEEEEDTELARLKSCPVTKHFRATASTSFAPDVKPNSPIAIIVVCVLLALAPFAVWTLRNWRVFHVIQPLAPRSATDPGEETHPGFERWFGTWSLDFVSTYYVYWNVPGDKLDIHQLPSRAFDSPAQYAETAAIINAYEANGDEISPETDARFNQLAEERIRNHPLRCHLWLPLGRAADMWLRPRIENLPIDLDWWVYKHHYAETRFSWFYAGLNALYIALGIWGLWLRPRFRQWMLLYMLLRSALLATVAAPEARYTLECFPMLFALGGIALGKLSGRNRGFNLSSRGIGRNG